VKIFEKYLKVIYTEYADALNNARLISETQVHKIMDDSYLCLEIVLVNECG